MTIKAAMPMAVGYRMGMIWLFVGGENEEEGWKRRSRRGEDIYLVERHCAFSCLASQRMVE